MNLGRFLHMRMQGASIDAPIANDIFGGGQGGTTQTIQKSDPWEGVQPYLRDLFGRGNTLSYGGNPLAGQSAQTLQSQQLTGQRALAGSPLNQAAQQENLANLRGDYTDLSKNPAAQSAMDLARSKINSQFMGDNNGNSAHQEWLSKGLLSAAAPFYESERQRQFGAQSLAPTLANQDYTDLGMLGQVGAQKDTRAQTEVDAPWMPLQRLQSLLSGQGGGTSQSTNPYFTNPLASALGLGLGGLGLYNGLGAAGLFGGGAAAAGGGAALGGGLTAGAGALMPAFAFSDERVKENVERVGTHDSGVGLYKYNYIGDDNLHVGVLAQEFKKVRPDAVRNFGGILAVDYNKV